MHTIRKQQAEAATAPAKQGTILLLILSSCFPEALLPPIVLWLAEAPLKSLQLKPRLLGEEQFLSPDFLSRTHFGVSSTEAMDPCLTETVCVRERGSEG